MTNNKLNVLIIKFLKKVLKQLHTINIMSGQL